MVMNSILSFERKSLNDDLTDLLRLGAQQLLKQAIEEEIRCFLEGYDSLRSSEGHAQVVRNGYLPERAIQTGIGPIRVQVPRARDRSGSGIKFTSSLLPPYLKRSKSISELLPCLYLKGLSSGDFTEALSSLLGPEAAGLSPSSICRLKEVWQEEFQVFQQRDLSGKRYVYFWVDGVYISVREQESLCILVIIGADETGKKELVALKGGGRESELSWHDILLDLKNRGLICSPELCIGDGSLGFWKAVSKVYGSTQKQRCWLHKSLNVLNYLPKSLQGQGKEHLQKIYIKSDTLQEAEKAFDTFIKLYEDKYPKATHCLEKDRKTLLNFFNFPASHWRSIRTTNPIESVFATVKHRTIKTKGCLSPVTAEVMAFKLIESAQKRWVRLHNPHYVADIIRGVKFRDGVALQSPEQDNHSIQKEQICAV